MDPANAPRSTNTRDIPSDRKSVFLRSCPRRAFVRCAAYPGRMGREHGAMTVSIPPIRAMKRYTINSMIEKL